MWDDDETPQERRERLRLEEKQMIETGELMAQVDAREAKRTTAAKEKPTEDETAAWLADVEAHGGGRHNYRED